MAGTVIFVCIVLFSHSFASTHWLVTETGRIQAQDDSMFYLRRPHDLIALMEQEKSVEYVENLRKDLIIQKEEIDRKEDKDFDLETKFYNTESDCVLVGKSLVEFDLYVSTVLKLHNDEKRIHEFFDNIEDTALEYQSEPTCVPHMSLDFSMHAFEHLDSLRNRNNINMVPEDGLVAGIEIDFTNLGRLLAATLATQKNQTFYLYNLATLYWRVMGDAYQAIECARRALHLATREEKGIALINLGNVLHRSRKSYDASLVLHAAVDHIPNSPIPHFTLANVYTVLADYNRSATFFQNVILLNSDYSQDAYKRKHAVLCHSKLEKALEAQHASLQNTLKELRDYQKRYISWLDQRETLLKEQLPWEDRLLNELKDQDSKWKASLFGDDCFEFQEHGLNIISCNMNREHFLETANPVSNKVKVELTLNLESLLKNVENQAEKLEHVTKKSSILHSTPKTESSCLVSDVGNNHILPTSPILYVDEKSQDYVASSTQEDCTKSAITGPWTKDLPFVFLPPENKGYDVSKFLTKSIDVSEDEQHPLPWFPPTCDKLTTSETPYLKLNSIRDREQIITMGKGQEELQQLLFHYVNNDHETAEIGQRIVTALKKDTLPRWVLRVLSSFYWTSQGNMPNSVECLLHALKTVPLQYKDAVLVNLGAILLHQNHIKDAMEIAKEAYEIAPYDPSTNNLLANCYVLKMNVTGAVEHYRKSYRHKPNQQFVMQQIQKYECHVKFNLGRKNIQPMCRKVPDMPGELCNMGPDIHSISPALVEGQCVPAIGFKCVSSTPSAPYLQAIKKGKVEEESMELLVDDTDLSILKDTDAQKMYLMVSLNQKPVAEDKIDIPAAVLANAIHDDELPDNLIQFTEGLVPIIPDDLDCDESKEEINFHQVVSTWLSMSARGIDMDDILTPSPDISLEPYCQSNIPGSMLTYDHLSGVRYRRDLPFHAETLLVTEALPNLNNYNNGESVKEIGNQIGKALGKNSSSWVLATAAALYWRTIGKADKAVDCVRQALFYAPYNMKDIPLISLANIFHHAGLYNDAIIVTNAALQISPHLVVSHFTMANIYATKGDLKSAAMFYKSSLIVDPLFQPSQERLNQIYCTLSQDLD